jgi:hypothetical protein
MKRRQDIVFDYTCSRSLVSDRLGLNWSDGIHCSNLGGLIALVARSLQSKSTNQSINNDPQENTVLLRIVTFILNLANPTKRSQIPNPGA